MNMSMSAEYLIIGLLIFTNAQLWEGGCMKGAMYATAIAYMFAAVILKFAGE